MSDTRFYTVSGPGIDAKVAPAVALSRAITAASFVRDGETVYVRNADGEVRGRVERHDRGELRIYGERWYDARERRDW